MPEFKVDIQAGGAFPGEAMIVAIFNYATKVRETMSQENRDRYDAINVAVLEDWRKIWKKAGLIPD